MSWANLKELIFQERKILDSPSAPQFPQASAFETPQSALLGAYLNTKPHVEAAVSYFARTLDWPELTPLEKFFVVARFDFAWEVLSILNTAHDGDALIAFPALETTASCDVLEWLLLDIWPYGCGRFLQAQKAVTQHHESKEREFHSPASLVEPVEHK